MFQDLQEDVDELLEDPDTTTKDHLVEAVEDDADHHPLQREYLFWTNAQGNQGGAWEDSLQMVNPEPITTVEGFWKQFRAMKLPSVLDTGVCYHVLPASCRPTSQDPTLRNGGKWAWTLPAGEDPNRLDVVWERTVMGVLGGSFDIYPNLVCGAVLGKKKQGGARIAVWTLESGRGDNAQGAVKALLALGHRIRTLVQIQREVKMEFYAHDHENRPGPVLCA
eukprot:PhF_6_TR9511/c0_g1_i1/m.14824/K03259/EIF4E; translation initiation factor 4E